MTNWSNYGIRSRAKSKRLLKGHTGPVSSLGFSRDNKLLVSASVQ